MKPYLAAVALVAALAQPAAAVTFPTLTTIYVGTGVRDATGVHTVFLCSNVSGLTAGIRIVVLEGNGTVAGSYQLLTVPHGALLTVVTSSSGLFPAGDMGIARCKAP